MKKEKKQKKNNKETFQTLKDVRMTIPKKKETRQNDYTNSY